MITAFVTVILVIFGTARFFLLNRFIKLEEENVHQNLLQISNALQNELDSLKTIVGDWANWDDSYQFIESGNSEYIKKNLLDDSYSTLGLNLILYINKSGKIVYGRLFDLETGNDILYPSIIEKISANQALLFKNDHDQSKTGIVILPQGSPILVSASPILTSERKGPSRGTLVMGRFLNEYKIEKITQITHLPLQISPYQEFLKMNQTAVFKSPVNGSVFIQPLNNQEILGSILIKDISGKPALAAYLKLPRTIYHQGQSSFHYFLIALAVVGVIIVLLIIFTLNKLVISRLTSLNSFVNRITINNDLSIRFPTSGDDELTNFTKVLNQMITSLEQSRFDLEESKQKLMDIIEFFPDATLVIDGEHKVVAWNRAMEKLTAVKKEEMIGKGDYLYAIPFYGKPRPILIDLVNADPAELKKYYNQVERNGSTIYTEVYTKITVKEENVYLGITASPLLNSQGEMAGAIQSLRNISTQKKAEEDLKYLSLHDQLTGLYNRSYFEEEIRRLDSGRNHEAGVIMCDVDGLKLVNDSLGHSTGDKLLKAAATVLKNSFRSNDMVARIGGDEFAVLIPQSNEKVLESAQNRIEKAVELYNRDNPELPLSISMGWAFRKDPGVSLKQIIEEADNNMYRNKLLRNRSAHSSIVQALMKTLNVRDFNTENHGDRLKNLVVRFSHQLGLPEQKIHDLSLLARFHDIGKVGIPDRILFKPGPLTSEEWTIMKGHAEIGYNIAKSAQELLHVSEWILAHHERWDGQGYPRGIKGAEIPLECRILSIIDAYDAMTSDRPYRKALSHQEAVVELQKNAGTQFDPELVEEFLAIMEA